MRLGLCSRSSGVLAGAAMSCERHETRSETCSELTALRMSAPSALAFFSFSTFCLASALSTRYVCSSL